MFRIFPLITLLLATALHAADRPNILFIAVDDLRPELASYGVEKIHSPNIDRLADQGALFERAYVQVPVCGASRASLLSGVRPAPDRFITYYTKLEEDLPGAPSLPQYLRENGYETRGMGKIFHHVSDTRDRSWSEWIDIKTTGSWRNYVTQENIDLESDGKGKRGMPYEKADVPDNAYLDGQIAERGIEQLQQLKDSEKPFFLALGFVKPHLPFNAPSKYWDLYDEADIELADNPFQPENAPDRAMHTFGELRAYTGIPRKGPVDDEMARKLIHGYYACVSYMDAQVGKVLDELDRLGLRENTIVILWGDHGWHLGEHGLWCKHCNFEKVMRAPLIIDAPGYPQGERIDALVEFIDIFPTLVQLTGLPLPAHLQGQSMVPLLKNPHAPWKEAAFSRWHDGYSVITEQYIFTQWIDKDGQSQERMLYDLEADPGENVNIAERPENAELVAELEQKVRQSLEMAKVDPALLPKQ